MNTLSFEQARHLALRTGFGPELEIIQPLTNLDRGQAVDMLLTAPRNHLTAQPVFQSFHQLRALGKVDKIEDTRHAAKARRKDMLAMKNWAITQALQAPNPLQEKMTWFWHNHFTSSSRSSGRSANLLMNQSLSIRREALGDFATLLSSMTYDPLMLLYLDGARNRKGKPNENFARELLELFTLGEGHFTEQDVKNTARAFTGWRIDNTTQLSRLYHRHFDNGKKIILGKKGRLNSDDVLTHILKQPRTAQFIADKMWHEFISIAKPDTVVTARWADTFRSSHYDISALVRAVLTDDVFWQPNYRGQLIKSPLDLIVGTLRSLDLEDNNLPLASIRNQLKRMGQDLHTPPNVKGWPGGASWVDDATLPRRQQFIRQMMRGSKNRAAASKNIPMISTMKSQTMNSMEKMAPEKQKQSAKPTLQLSALPELPVEHWETWLLPIKATTNIDFTKSEQRLKAILLDPAYQLK